MSSEEDIKYVAEWECDEGQNEEFGIEATEGEEAGRCLTRIETAWNSCEKLKTDATYHQRYIPINDAFGLVCITVKLGLTGRSACGTGFYIRISEIVSSQH